MKLHLTIFLIIICPQITCAQIQMDIVEMTLSKLKKESYQEFVTNGKDTIALALIESGEYDNPFFEARIRLRNFSDSIVILYPNNAKLYISYSFEERMFKKNLSFSVEQADDNTIPINRIVLQPDQDFYLLSSGYIVDHPSMLYQFSKQEDNTINVMKILPTLKCHYKDNKTGLEIIHQDVLNVKIRKLPTGSEFIIPEGYHLLEEVY